MNFVSFICALVLSLVITQYSAHGKNSHHSLPKEYRRFNIFDKFNYILFQNAEQFAENLKTRELIKKELEEKEKKKKEKIYRDYLASRDMSSFSKDFHILRY